MTGLIITDLQMSLHPPLDICQDLFGADVVEQFMIAPVVFAKFFVRKGDLIHLAPATIRMRQPVSGTLNNQHR